MLELNEDSNKLNKPSFVKIDELYVSITDIHVEPDDQSLIIDN